MDYASKEFRPHARQRDFIAQELPDELLLYDVGRDQAHCLNALAATIWKHADGQATPAEIAGRVGKLTNAPVTEDAVWHALYQLSDFHLLEDAAPAVAHAAGVSRRQLMIRMAGIAAASLPLVTSIVAPVAAQTGSGPTGMPGPTGAVGPGGL